ncbi:MAG: NepR family anti-sigma factor [Pseudomonadota bacterium]
MSRANRTSSIDEEIERNLKRAYDDVAEQELPSRLTDLLAQLKAQDADATVKPGPSNGEADAD